MFLRRMLFLNCLCIIVCFNVSTIINRERRSNQNNVKIGSHISHITELTKTDNDNNATNTVRYYPLFETLTENKELIFRPLDLLSAWRFDIMAKYIYAKYRELGAQNNWARLLYGEHLKVWGNFTESWPKKSGLDQFLQSFNEILDSIKLYGFSTQFSVVPIDKRKLISNGSHRVAACLLYNQDVVCKYYSKWQSPLASAEYFRKNQQYVRGGLPQKYLDAMALEYCVLKKNTYIVHVFPIVPGNDEMLRLVLNEYGNIVYEKKVHLHHNGPLNYIRLTYQGDSWLGTVENNFLGARIDAKKKFGSNSNPMRVFLFECDNLAKIIECKKRLRSLFNFGNYSIHINDTHEQSVELAQTLFNDNSIHVLNWAHQARFGLFERFILEYKSLLKKMNVPQECFCVDSSAVLSVYGIRECKDLDFLHHGYDQEIRTTQTKFVSSHNSSLHHHTISLDDIIFNPDNYFYYKGLKFAALHVIKNMKTRRNEEKDTIDLKLIENHFNVWKKRCEMYSYIY